MFITDPDTPAADTGAPDPAAAAADAPAADEVTDDGGMLAAITEDLPEGAESAAAVAEDAVPGTNEAAAAERGEKPESGDKAAKPDKPEAAKPEDKKPEPDAEIAAEAKSLGLKDKANERFVSMAKEIKELAPLRDALKEAGIEDVKQIPVLAKRAKDGDDLVGMVTDTGCTADDFARVLDYMGTIAKGRNGDRAAVEAAFKVVGDEYAAIAKALGREIPGVHDPLAEHADLTAAIEAGDMTRKHALEVAQARTTAAAQQQRQQATTQQAQATQAQQEAEQAGVNALKAWEAPRLADPAYATIRPALNAKVAEIRKQFPPAQWAAVTDMAYQALAAEAKAAASLATPAAPRQPVPGPVRPGGPRPAMVPTTDDPLEAMMQGIAAATP